MSGRITCRSYLRLPELMSCQSPLSDAHDEILFILMRFGFAPLYVGYEDVLRAVETLREVLQHRLWDRDDFKAPNAVT